jgi:hypothetical protein
VWATRTEHAQVYGACKLCIPSILGSSRVAPEAMVHNSRWRAGFCLRYDATTPAKQCQVVNTETGVNTTACSSFSGTCQQTCLPLYVPTDAAVAGVSCTTQSPATGFVAGNTNYGRLGVTTGNNYAVAITATRGGMVRGQPACISGF